MTATIFASDVAKKITLRVEFKGFRVLGWRLRVAARVIKLGGRIAGVPVVVEPLEVLPAGHVYNRPGDLPPTLGVRPLTDGPVCKSGRNTYPSQITERPAPPAPINPRR